MGWGWGEVDSLPPTRARPQSGLLQTAFSLVGEREVVLDGTRSPYILIIHSIFKIWIVEMKKIDCMGCGFTTGQALSGFAPGKCKTQLMIMIFIGLIIGNNRQHLIV